MQAVQLGQADNPLGNQTQNTKYKNKDRKPQRPKAVKGITKR